MHRKIQPGVSRVGQTTAEDPCENLDEKETRKREFAPEAGEDVLKSCTISYKSVTS